MKTKMKMVNKNGYWTDRHGNGWSVTVNTKEQAIEKSRSLIDCYACVDCYDCRDCNSCVNCHDCHDCRDCRDCY